MSHQNVIGENAALPRRYFRLARFFFGALLILSAGAISSCSSPKKVRLVQSSHINDKTKFSSKEFGVRGSPRVTRSKRVRKGGGYYRVGKPYKIRGKWYKPKLEERYVRTGVASWYGPNFHGRLTANGEIYDQYSLSAAHPTMPLPSYARVTNLENGSSVVVRVNDRGPYAHGRLIDLSAKAAELLNYQEKGVARVKVKYLGRARMDGRDQRKLLASYSPSRSGVRKFKMPGSNFSGTMLASRGVKDASFVTAFTSVPIPQQRPTLYRLLDGVPIILSSSDVISYRIKPLAYLAD